MTVLITLQLSSLVLLQHYANKIRIQTVLYFGLIIIRHTLEDIWANVAESKAYDFGIK